MIKVITGTGVALIIYGYFARLASLYFFWESRYVGFMVLFVAGIFYLFNRISARRKEGRRSLPEKIAAGILVFMLVLQGALFFIFPSTDAYRVATDYIRHDSKLQTKIGNITGISPVPKGSVDINTGNNVSYGEATFYFIVKGSRKYTDIVMEVRKDPTTDWTITRYRSFP